MALNRSGKTRADRHGQDAIRRQTRAGALDEAGGIKLVQPGLTLCLFAELGAHNITIKCV